MKFNELNLIPPILDALKYEGYTEPTPIQAKAIPIVLRGQDLIGSAQTGTGKTAAFALPMLQLLSQEQRSYQGPRRIRALIITPTRELAAQIDDSLTAYNRFMHLTHTVIIGGIRQYSQEKALRKGVDILVATPGRLLDLMEQKIINIEHVRMFVIDEADRMLDMGFIPDVKKIVAKLPRDRQALLFSATMPPAIDNLARTILTDPQKVAVSPVYSTADTVQHSVYFVDKSDKKALLIHVLEETPIPNALVFVRTKHGANRLSESLRKVGIKSQAIHGNKSQNQRQRALDNFKAGKTRVLVATDVAARGIDIEELSHVINYDLPNEPETYIHRIGRTGRAGLEGTALSFCNRKEKSYLRDIQILLKRVLPVVVNHPYHMNISVPLPQSQERSKKPYRRRYSSRPKSGGNSSGENRGKRKRSRRSNYRPKKSNQGIQAKKSR